MLRITMNKSAGGAKKYYSEEYYSEGQSNELNYYSEKDQAIGRWGGKAAEELGLAGDILKKDFASLCDNINPVTGKTLTGRNDVDRRVGYDFTFNASKSVSLAYSFGNDEDKKEILTAFQSSVRETVSEIETGMQARVRDKGKNENRETGNIAYGEFTHFTTRPIDGVPDPHLHSHCFIFNATYDKKDKKWKAGEFGQIKQDAAYYEAVFHSKLASKLEAMGYRVEKTDNGFELVGIEKKTLDKFSRRTKEIEEHAREHNITDDKKKSQIGAKTREAKRVDITPAEQQENWKSRISSAELAEIYNLKKRSAGFTKKQEEDDVASEAVKFSLEHHLERKSVASDKEILATAIKSSIGMATPEQIKQAFNSDNNILIANENLRTFITTKEALKEEKQLIKACIDMKGRLKPINENYELKSDILNDQQKAAVRHALGTTDQISIITGKAGTGKTTLMKEVKQGITEAGKQIYSFAPSSEASRGVQRSEGFKNADTVAKLVQDKNLHPQLKNQVIWIDEAGMLSNRDMNNVIEIAKQQSARIILSGDTKQHNSVQRGDALRIIQEQGGIKPITVSKIQRQKNEGYKQAVTLLSDGGIEKGFKKLENIGAIKEIADSKERITAIAEDYYSSAFRGKQKKDVLVIAPTHAEGELVTGYIRAKLKDKNVIGNDEREFTVFKNRQFTEAEKQKPENYNQGNLIVFHQNIKGVRKGARLEVMGHEGSNLLARDSKGMPFDVPVSQAKNFSVFEVRKVQVTKGDKIRITGNGKSEDGKHLFNGTTYNIHAFDKQGNIRLSNGSVLSKEYGHFNLGYVMTSHSSQGKTADKVIISQSSATFRASSIEQFYVSVSRGKQAVSIYTDDKESLKQAVSRSVQRTSATELLSNNQRLMNTAVENNRLSIFKKMRERAAENYEKLKTKMRNNELQRTVRTKPGKTR